MFSFNTRINRMSYYVAYVTALAGLILVIELLVYLVGLMPHAGSLFHSGSAVDFAVGVVSLVAYAVIFVGAGVYIISLVRRRANDVSAENALLLTVLAFIISPFALVLGLFPGHKQPNKYGAVPSKGIHLK